MAWSLRPLAWLWVARPLVGGSVPPARSGAWEVLGGDAFAAPPGGVVASGSVGGSWAAGGGGSLCRCPSLCLPYTGTKVGFAGVAQLMEAVVCMLLWFVFVRSSPGAV